MAWLRRNPATTEREAGRPLLDPDPLRTPDDAYETGLLIGLLKNAWEAVAMKNLKDRRIATGDDASPSVGPAGHVAGKAAGHRPTEDEP